MTTQAFITVGTAAATTINVSRTSVDSERAQGIVLEADHPLEVSGITARRIVLWSDTAPESADVVTTEAGEIRIWNVWRDDELTQSWTGNSSISVDDAGDDLGLTCHDGHGSDGPNLVVRLSFDRAWTQPHDRPHLGA